MLFLWLQMAENDFNSCLYDRKFKPDIPPFWFYQIGSIKSIFSQNLISKKKNRMTLHTKNHPISTIKKSCSGQALVWALYPTQSLLIHGGLNPSSPALTNPLIICVVAGGRITTVFPLSKILSHFVRKPRFNLLRNCVTNSVYTTSKVSNDTQYVEILGCYITNM